MTISRATAGFALSLALMLGLTSCQQTGGTAADATATTSKPGSRNSSSSVTPNGDATNGTTPTSPAFTGAATGDCRSPLPADSYQKWIAPYQGADWYQYAYKGYDQYAAANEKASEVCMPQMTDRIPDLSKLVPDTMSSEMEARTQLSQPALPYTDDKSFRGLSYRDMDARLFDPKTTEAWAKLVADGIKDGKLNCDRVARTQADMMRTWLDHYRTKFTCESPKDDRTVLESKATYASLKETCELMAGIRKEPTGKTEPLDDKDYESAGENDMSVEGALFWSKDCKTHVDVAHQMIKAKDFNSEILSRTTSKYKMPAKLANKHSPVFAGQGMRFPAQQLARPKLKAKPGLKR